MNLTEFRCTLKILGWKLTIAQRQSRWNDTYGNSIVFKDDTFETRLRNEKQGRTIKKYDYFTNLVPIIEEIIEHTEKQEQAQEQEEKARAQNNG